VLSLIIHARHTLLPYYAIRRAKPLVRPAPRKTAHEKAGISAGFFHLFLPCS